MKVIILLLAILFSTGALAHPSAEDEKNLDSLIQVLSDYKDCQDRLNALAGQLANGVQVRTRRQGNIEMKTIDLPDGLVMILSVKELSATTKKKVSKIRVSELEKTAVEKMYDNVVSFYFR